MRITSVERRLIDNSPIPAGIKDENYRYVYVNQHYANIVGIKNYKDVIGLTVKDLPTTSSRCSSEFNDQDLWVMQNNRHLPAYCIYKTDDDATSKVYRYVKHPYKNSNNIIKGVYFSTEDFTKKTFINVGAIVASKDKEKILENINKVSKLSSKMQSVLFMVCLGKYAKEIAAYMGVSERTAESYIEQLKIELDTHHKTGMSAFGASSCIPASILKEDVPLVINDDV